MYHIIIRNHNLYVRCQMSVAHMTPSRVIQAASATRSRFETGVLKASEAKSGAEVCHLSFQWKPLILARNLHRSWNCPRFSHDFPMKT